VGQDVAGQLALVGETGAAVGAQVRLANAAALVPSLLAVLQPKAKQTSTSCRRASF